MKIKYLCASASRKSTALKLSLRAAALGVVMLACFARVSSTSAQEAITGQWIIEPNRGKDSVHLTIQRNSNGHSNWNSSNNVKMDSFRGLSQTQSAAGGSTVQFQIVRDAGVFNCEGWFKDGRGSGHFTFAANPAYSAELKRRGFTAPTEEQQFSLAMHDVSLAFVDELRAQGYEQPTLDQLVR